MKRNNKAIVLSLIQDDLKITKFTSTLREMGINADDYMLNLPVAIFALMGIPDTQETDCLYDHYFVLTKKSIFIDFSTNEAEELSEIIYKYLEMVKPKQKKASN